MLLIDAIFIAIFSAFNVSSSLMKQSSGELKYFSAIHQVLSLSHQHLLVYIFFHFLPPLCN
ncbi:MAG: hypothetical protein WBZ36_28005, partial [Candidatus Nitrosopolaris sp.]